MNYLYHRVPENMQGSVLYPLNMLKEKYPEIYQKQFSKYMGREELTKSVIPILNCLWNDVLHFSPIHPAEIKTALVEAGWSSDFYMQYYQIDPRVLDLKSTVVYFASPDNKINDPNPDSFIPYNPTDLEKFSVMSEKNKQHYKEVISQGGRPLLYPWITHILYQGSIDVANFPIVSV